MTTYNEWAESKAKTIVESGVATEDALREILILACHSSKTADAFLVDRIQDEAVLARLVKIAIDEDDHGGDAPMEAAYRVQRYSARMLRAHVAALLRGFPVTEVGYNDALALALAKTRDPRAEQRIVDASGSLTDAGLERALAALKADDES